MNKADIGIIILVVLIAIAIFLSLRYKSATTIALYTLGFVFLAISIYLFPASSWSFFAITALTLGIIMIITSTVIIIKKHKNNIK